MQLSDPLVRSWSISGPAIVLVPKPQDKVIARAMPQGDILGFAPPFCLTRQEADTVVAATVKAVKTVLG